MSVRCKVVCSFVDNTQKIVHFHPVYSGSDENKAFWDATPGGTFSFYCVNDETRKSFESGKEYYFDIFKAE